MIDIHGRKVGEGYPAYIVAEIGINHGGDTALAIQMINAAKRAGCDAVKFQNYKTDQFIGQRSEYLTYGRHQEHKERQEAIFRRCELDKPKLKWLKNHCDRIGIHMHSTPMCIEGLQECVDLGFGVIKNGSDCLQDLELIRWMAMSGLPIVISTGMARRQEIAAALEVICHCGAENRVILLHCTSAYPCPDSDANIQRVKILGDDFSCMSGLSDHTEGITAAILSIAFGAVWIEKHFTIDKNMPGPDHWFSADEEEMTQLVTACHRAVVQYGNGGLGLTALEVENRKAWFK